MQIRVTWKDQVEAIEFQSKYRSILSRCFYNKDSRKMIPFFVQLHYKDRTKKKKMSGKRARKSKKQGKQLREKMQVAVLVVFF